MMRLFEKRHNYKGFQVEPGFVNWVEGDMEFITSGFQVGDKLKAYMFVGGEEWLEQDWATYERQDDIMSLQERFYLESEAEEGGECA